MVRLSMQSKGKAYHYLGKHSTDRIQGQLATSPQSILHPRMRIWLRNMLSYTLPCHQYSVFLVSFEFNSVMPVFFLLVFIARVEVGKPYSLMKLKSWKGVL
ncbi:unnamed protein product (mitochondrion) [Musa textilis]